MSKHPRDLISAYADGELAGDQVALVEAHLAGCTECARDLVLIKSMGEAMNLNKGTTPPRDVWRSVHNRITQPVGWLLFVAGVAVWIVMGVVEWIRSGELTWRWLAGTAVAIGLVLIAVAVGYEQYKAWRMSPYRDLER